MNVLRSDKSTSIHSSEIIPLEESTVHAVWNVCLTDEEIEALALGVLPLYIQPEYLVRYIPLMDKEYELVGEVYFGKR